MKVRDPLTGTAGRKAIIYSCDILESKTVCFNRRKKMTQVDLKRQLKGAILYIYLPYKFTLPMLSNEYIEMK